LTADRRSFATYLAVAGLLVVAGLALFVVLAGQSAPRLASSNSRVTLSRYSVDVPPGGRHCQGGEHVPAVADRIRLFPSAGTDVGGVVVELREADGGGRPVAVGVDGSLDDRGELFVDLPPRARDLDAAQLCVRNEGARPASFAGNLTPFNPEAVIGPNGYGKRDVDEIRADYFRPGRESYLGLFGTMAERAALFKPSFAGAWLLPMLLVAAVLIGAFALAVGALAVRDPSLVARRRRLAAAECPHRTAPGRAGVPRRRVRPQ